MLILANAIYFKGVWTNEFDERLTRDRDFYLMNGASIQVPFMSSSDEQYVKAFNDVKILKLPYRRGKDKSRQFSMYIILPNANDGLLHLMETITKNSGFLERHAPKKQVEVGEFRIPKFEVSFDFNVLSTLRELEVEILGDDLREMVIHPLNSPCVSFIAHKCVVDVNERGTKAVAFTGMGCFGCSYMRVKERIDFVADHPFAFFIREDVSGTVVFGGTVLNPRS
ncbi:unnamed protein product [Cuscuta epithymum]|uniref:Serpin domain-containing protein n=1 Tax=Cuscuta epithymum TaxID=186058 RepID=A0AAV0D5P1_9ASTE|nr:unnamed protein product [Cuscuta epithymum]